MKNYIGISRDHSASMRSIEHAAARDYNDNIAAIRDGSTREGQDTIVSVVKCGVGQRGSIEREVVNSNVSKLKPLNESRYGATGWSTPLFDSVGDLIEILEAAPDKDKGDVSFLVMAITDGLDNASRRWSASSLSRKIQQLQGTDRWTFVFRVPRGYKRSLVGMGIPEGNILEWDQTEQGVQVATIATRQAFDAYYSDRSRGLTSTRNFYTTDLSKVTARTVKSKLIDISDEVDFWNVQSQHDGMQIRDFVERKLRRGEMKKGAAFYQLTKPEKEVQDYKQIAIRDKKTKAVYSGVEARNILGLPHNGTVKVVPGNHGAYDIFIQSTSVNRKLVAGTQVMYWDDIGQ